MKRKLVYDCQFCQAHIEMESTNQNFSYIFRDGSIFVCPLCGWSAELPDGSVQECKK